MRYTTKNWNDLYDALLKQYEGLNAACKAELRESLLEDGNDHLTVAYEYHDEAVRVLNKINQLIDEYVNQIIDDRVSV